ncbi:unnamed protein product [Acanthoscelides obtectus]|uniref:Uncharacterized protein n=1 Tax=Acanthoscelides obtectus TaxID=200917 RepID=A0A9P0JSF0_ACAOB|nr:unnamed protein product [Acanthoscelides obtectus]CAK1665741.1 hypothetical protein AOBTE_LOCUS24946 [Acanthoscelides obtectus]
MERIFKIKTKSDKDPRDQYPSERRYSASIVIGLGVVYLQLFFYSILMGTLIVHRMTVSTTEELMLVNETDTALEESFNLEGIKRLNERLAKDIEANEVQETPYYINVPALVSGGCFVMAVGYLLSFCTAVLAWKQWYVDQNITFFFLASSFSTITSSLSLLVSILTCINMNVDIEKLQNITTESIPLTLSLAINIVILSAVGVIWSCLATKVAYRGMRSSYPDDMFVKGRGTVEISTTRKGSKNANIFPPDIISHFPVTDKLAKYLPRKEDNDLPKAESNLEYRQRVDQFLNGSVGSNEDMDNKENKVKEEKE